MQSNVGLYRKAKGMKQFELAKLAEISQPTLSQIETGTHTPNILIAMKIAQALETDIYKLFTDPQIVAPPH